MHKEKDLVAFCGLYCGDCFGYQGKVADLARDLRKELRRTKFDIIASSMSSVSFFEVFKNYEQCYQVLGALLKLRCRKACRGGGGPPFCRVRKCCLKRGIEGCWQCAEFETCEKFDFLKEIHGIANIKNLRKIKKNGMDSFLKGKKYWIVKN